ncbi:type II secretion system F family protein [Lichenicola cladoniae]|uniref:Type II secretion system F family protein n=1 Tax=Lichenicola cladoniae TaxID=1484109 RepID=A0A6M8H980_9PROT|nr:type II secretion system F family protein [Lichenicola cladoniae]NPD69196.1 type II secretion system F family protein [Acetobacteraceae bacterium]QKE89023.1 type II secretion system F family protein [Lichenicola cladoniae]
MIQDASISGGLEAAVSLFAGLLLAGGTVAIDRRLATNRIRVRIKDARNRAMGMLTEEPEDRPRPIAAMIAALGSVITASGLLSVKTRAELEQTLRAGGMMTSHNFELFVGAKILLAIGAPVGAFALLRHAAMRPILLFGLVAAAAIVGLMLPNMIIGQRRKTYLAAIEKGLADGLDMMVICAEAGLALESTIQRVSVEVVHAHPKLATELTITYNELTLGSDTRTALVNMGERTGLVSLRRLGTTLVQSIQYGTPLSLALRTLATELRQETLTRFEERAARLPVLLTIPMILFILPCVFLIVAGPIAVQVLKAMKH